MVASIDQPVNPLSNPPLTIASCGSEHDAVRKLKHAEVALLPHELLADTCHEKFSNVASSWPCGIVKVVLPVVNVRTALSVQSLPSNTSISYCVAWSTGDHVKVVACATPSAPLAGEVSVGPPGTCDRITTWVVVVRVSSALDAWIVTVYVPG